MDRLGSGGLFKTRNPGFLSRRTPHQNTPFVWNVKRDLWQPDAPLFLIIPESRARVLRSRLERSILSRLESQLREALN